MSSRQTSSRDPFGLGQQGLDGFYRTVREAAEAATKRDVLRGQMHHIRRAFEVMALDGVLCVEDRPTVFFKNYREPLDRTQANLRQRECWNQGCASVLVLQDPQRLHLYSALATPSPDDASGEISDHAAWIESLARTANTLEAYRLAENLASGHFYRQHWKKFDFKQAVDRQLVRYLGMVCDGLADGGPEDLKRVHAFLGRVIFVCYLVDRGVIDLGEMHFIRRKGIRTIRDLLIGYPPAQAADLLDQLFRSLRREFNGSLFEYDADQERGWLNEDRVQLLGGFLDAKEPDTGQRTLGFWAYDFSAIPVETISAIYEDFLKREDADEKEIKGAFFTPRNLAEMTVDEALRGIDTLLGKRFLDPRPLGTCVSHGTGPAHLSLHPRGMAAIHPSPAQFGKPNHRPFRRASSTHAPRSSAIRISREAEARGSRRGYRVRRGRHHGPCRDRSLRVFRLRV